MIRVEQLHNVMMEYNDTILWIKYDDANGVVITCLDTQEVLEGTDELNVLRYIIDKLSIVTNE